MTNYQNKGWVRLHRKIEDNPLWFLEPFTKAQAWVDLFLNTNHTENSINIRGNIIKIKRGQIGWSELTMVKRWKWSKGKVRRFLKLLETEQQIIQQKDRYLTTIITILNYEEYQTDKNNTADDTAERQQKDSRRYINNNDKNEKNENKPFGETSSPVWNYSDYLKNLIESKRRDYNIIGRYFRFRGLVFPTKDAANAELKRFLVDAKTLKDYKDEDIAEVAEWTKNKYTPDKWNLGTIAKIIPNYLANKNQNGN